MSNMSDNMYLEQFGRAVKNAKRFVEKYPQGFVLIHNNFMDNINYMSLLMNDKRLREAFLYLMLQQRPFISVHNDIFHEEMKKQLNNVLEEKDIESRVNYTFINTIKELSPDCISLKGDSNIDHIKRDIDDKLKDLSEEVKTYILLKICKCVELTVPRFIKESEELITYYDNLIDATKEGWEKVYKVINEYTLKWDIETQDWLGE